MKVLITGARGFVGSFLVSDFELMDVEVVPLSRGKGCYRPQEITLDLTCEDIPPSMLVDIDVIVHCAGRAHVMNEREPDPYAAFQSANVEMTRKLARAAKAASVRRLVFLSSIKVNGEKTARGKPFEPDDPPNPSDPYALSKLEAESVLADFAEPGVFDVVIVRPPLIYGPNPKGNMRTLMRAIQYGIPIPLGKISGNSRSYVSLKNLSSFLFVCLSEPAAANQTFLISDGENISTATLIQNLSLALGRHNPAFNFPPRIISSLLRMVGKQGVSERLLSNLEVSITKNETLLGWRPNYSFKQGLEN